MKAREVCLLLVLNSIMLTMLHGKAKDMDTCYLKMVSIEGSSNINSFFFTYLNLKEKATHLPSDEYILRYDGGILDFRIPVKAFKGSNPAMTSDFMELLKAKNFPSVSVGFEKSKFDAMSSYDSPSYLNLHITLAGVTKEIKARCSLYNTSDNKQYVSGFTQFNLTDFYLEPPRKAFGLIRVKDMVTIQFDIFITSSKAIQTAQSKQRVKDY
jgi:hypothetical protein